MKHADLPLGYGCPPALPTRYKIRTANNVLQQLIRTKNIYKNVWAAKGLTTRTAFTLSVCLVLASLGLKPSDELGDGELLGENSVRASAASGLSDRSGR